MIKRNKKNKIINIISRILYDLLMIFCVILIAIIIIQKISNNSTSIGGYRIFRVVSGSMEPKYGIGEVVVSKDEKGEKINVGDSVVYLGKTQNLNGIVIMHEIVEINKDENGKLKFITKGIANKEEDPEISEEQIYGVVKCKLGVLTLLYKLAESPVSYFIIVMALIINIFLAFLPKINYEKVRTNKKIKSYKKIKRKKYYTRKNQKKKIRKMR